MFGEEKAPALNVRISNPWKSELMTMSRPRHRYSCMLLLILLVPTGCKRTDSTSGGDGAKDPGNGAAPVNNNLPYEPRPSHPRVELSNLRIKPPKNDKEIYEVDWKMTKGDSADFVLVVRPSSGGESTRMIHTMRGKKSGTISGEFMAGRSADWGKPILASGCEMFLVDSDSGNRYKLSNSVTAGNGTATSTRPAP